MKECIEHHDFASLLVTAGIRVTPRRLNVLAVLHGGGKMSADEIIADPKSSRMDRVTVYRILREFEKGGVVYKTRAAHAGDHYELVDHHTHTVQCVQCGKSAIVACEERGRLLSQKVKGFAHVHAHDVALYGTCTQCVS